MSELKPCPFCGGEAELYASPAKDGWNYVFCKKCQTAGDNYDTEAEAIEAWNTRHERTTRIVQSTKGIPLGESIVYSLACETCGCGISTKDSYCRSCGARVKEEA